MTARAWLVAGALAGACGGTQPSIRGADDDDAIVYIDTPVKDAGVWVDGTFIGGMESLRGGVAVEPGGHRFEVRHDDYFAYYAELQLGARERKRLKVELAPVLP